MNNTVEKLLCNPEFINWVKNPNEESNLYWKKWLEEKPEDLESFAKAKKIILAVKFSEPVTGYLNPFAMARDFDRSLSDILKNNASATSQRIGASVKSNNTTWLKWSIAAVLAFFVLFAGLFLSKQSTVESPREYVVLTKQTIKGQKLRVLLPDHSIVVLNAASKIEFPEQFIGDTRTVKLEGEAFLK
ncbi:MAG: hypothetical protein HC819_22465 [Cyclobacteriaceae bacterium]|nr:hypothetical protein [Cyclobacteriaceae bacterium]